MEPISLFARIADPARVARRLRELAPAVQIDGPDETWRKAVLVFGAGSTRRTLTFTHNPAYYSEPNWSKQMSGMRGFFSRFPDTDRKPRVLMLTSTLKFSLGTLFDPDFDPKGDPRLGVVYTIAELLDGVLFTPSSLRDARGRVLFSSGGKAQEDPNAVWPRVAAEVSIADPVGAAAHEASRPKPPADQGGRDNTPTAQRVARRALAMTSLTARAILERDLANPRAREIHRDLMDWVRDIAIEDEFEPEERAIWQQPLGEVAKQQQIDTTWRLEGLVVLAWALGRFEMPPHDQLVEFNSLWKSLGFLDSPTGRALLANPALRSREEIGAVQNRMFALHWRLRNFYVDPKALDFAKFARTCRFGPLDIAGLPLVDGDLGLRGERIDRASPDAFSTVHSAVQERHRAANWLGEGPEGYSRASVAT